MTGERWGADPPGVDGQSLAATIVRAREQRAQVHEQLRIMRERNRRILEEVEGRRRQPGGAAEPPSGAAVGLNSGSNVDAAVSLLNGILASGPVPTLDVELRARSAGISLRTLARARRRAGVRAMRVGGFGPRGTWYCTPPPRPDDLSR